MAIHTFGRALGFCGQAPSNNPAYAEFLIRGGIDSISMDSSSVLTVMKRIARTERTHPSVR